LLNYYSSDVEQRPIYRSFVIEYTLENTARGNPKGTIQRNWQLVHKKNKKSPKKTILIVGHHYMQANTNNVINS
jgi:hypothetical protein